jgi:hypothetical protein
MRFFFLEIYPLGKKEKEKKKGRWAFWKVKCPLSL